MLARCAVAAGVQALFIETHPEPSKGKSDAGTYTPGQSLRDMLDDAERAIIRKALSHHQNNVTATAEALGLERSHLYKKMRALGLR